jgi:hypothetical protein
MLSEGADRCLGNADSGFLMGQRFTLIDSSYHALMCGPPGHKVAEFFSNLSRRSFSSGVEMTTWSIVNSQTYPIAKRFFERGWAQSALIGGILALRNGWAGVVGGAAAGAGQSIFMSLLQIGILVAWTPIHEWRAERTREWFNTRESRSCQRHPPSLVVKDCCLSSRRSSEKSDRDHLIAHNSF